MKNYTFPETGISLNQVLIEVGIKTVERDGFKYLQYEGEEIPRPDHSRCEEKIKNHFGINITYTK